VIHVTALSPEGDAGATLRQDPGAAPAPPGEDPPAPAPPGQDPAAGQAPPGAAADGQPRQDAGGARAAVRRRALTAAAIAGVACLLYLAYLGQARSFGTDSDGASNVLQAWDMLHGNLLLRGWWLSDVSFYTTELPEYMIVEAIHGLHATDIPAAAAATFTMLVLLAAALARGRTPGREGLIRALVAGGIMFAPGAERDAIWMLSSPDHVGTMVPVLAIFLMIDWLGDRGRWYLPVLAGAGLAWVQVADQLALYVGAVPVIVVCGIRLYQRRPSWRTDAGLLAAAVISVPVAALALRLIAGAGGFVVAGNDAIFTSSADLPHNLSVTAESVLMLFGADFFGLSPGTGAAIALLHLVGVALAAWGCCVAARGLLRGTDRVTPIILVGLVINLAAYLFTTESLLYGTARELAGVLPLGAVLAGRVLPGQLGFRKLLPALTAVLVVYAGVLGYYATRPADGQPPTQAVLAWLRANHQTSGIAGYWAANTTTAAAGGQVRVRAVVVSCDRFAPYAWETEKPWYEPPDRATFLVLGRNQAIAQNGTAAQATAQFGKPQRTARVGAYEVMVWDHNLLPGLSTGFRRRCGQRWPR
jgi:hypothetical protein